MTTARNARRIKILVKGKYQRILHLYSIRHLEFALFDLYFEDMEAIERIPDDRYGELEEVIIQKA